MFAAAERTEDVLHEVIGGSKTLSEEFETGSDIDILLLQVKLQEVIVGNLTRNNLLKESLRSGAKKKIFTRSVPTQIVFMSYSKIGYERLM